MNNQPDQPAPPLVHILVVANETVASSVLRDAILERGDTARVRVTVVAPALNSRVKHYVSDEDGARAAAERRLATCLEGLRAEGVAAEGTIGDADPFLAITDALHKWEIDEIIVATHPEGRSHWLERKLVERVRATCRQPVGHIVVESVGAEAPPSS